MRTLTQHLADASRGLAGHTAVDFIVDHGRHGILIGHCILDCKGDATQFAAGCDLASGLGASPGFVEM